MSLFRPIGALVLAWTLGACASSPYRAVQQAWTRSHEAYEHVAARAFVHATYKSAPFRRAYAEEYARLFALDPTSRDALSAAEREDAAQAHVIIAAFYTPERHWNDLNPRVGIWDVRLEGSRGRYVRPSSVTRLKKRNPTWAALYPYFHPQYTLYELRFDRTASDGRPLAQPGEPLTLVIAGAPAQIRLTWTLPR